MSPFSPIQDTVLSDQIYILECHLTLFDVELKMVRKLAEPRALNIN